MIYFYLFNFHFYINYEIWHSFLLTFLVYSLKGFQISFSSEIYLCV